jgi:glycosyltransferase involved in cell wall biosynthesis
MPHILFCCPTPLTARLGASKVYIEAAEAFRRIGWDAELVGPAEVVGRPDAGYIPPPLLHDWLRRTAAGFDVVEYEHNALPYYRSDFPKRPLFIARSVLLTHTVVAARIPPRPNLRFRVSQYLTRGIGRRRWNRELDRADATIRVADLVNVGNSDERAALVAAGHPAEKIVVFPFGLFPERLAAFRPVPDDLPDPPTVAFVGTFDPRKGMAEWPALAEAVAAAHPRARFRLVGTYGLVPTADGVLGYFPRRLRSRIQVIPKFDPAELPGLLADCSLGVFPSHCEGFGFGVLEMLAAGLPVVAYDAPGPPTMLPAENLVPKGDGRAAGRRAAALLADPIALRAARRAARARADQFRWEVIASRTADAYLSRLAEGRPDSVSRAALSTGITA